MGGLWIGALPGLGCFLDLILLSLRVARQQKWIPDSAVSKNVVLPGCDMFLDLACCRIWQLPGCGDFRDVAVIRMWQFLGCGIFPDVAVSRM